MPLYGVVQGLVRRLSNIFFNIITRRCIRMNCEGLQHFTPGYFTLFVRLQSVGKEEGLFTRRGRRRRKLLDDLKERRGYSHLKEEALCGELALEEALHLSVVRQTTK